ncbi:hypothetical protein LL06_00815 [Hoeflea sp. BAL378]|uniref:DUF7146 domain-containing protein n=1 Tax=Hoeflea sp. BAL378 TaxID=1547437 RepID=UPI0005135496|nr:primase-helicase zinc-binding domain-containing protein [Hoeflea sp. BAL378]KGF71167.1 hypothetical protein LL06_00815 [Hoeflea sp. BAL378]
MTEIIDDFVAKARDVTVEAAALRLKLPLDPKKRGDQSMPCPVCGGTDRFAIHPAENAWNCRGCGTGGRDGIGLVAHAKRLDLKRRAEFLEACALSLGEDVPDGAEEISDERRAEMKADAKARAEDAARKATERDRTSGEFREKELAKCRGIYAAAEPGISGTFAAEYLYNRSGLPVDARAMVQPARCVGKLTYWHGQDERGNPRDIWCGPALVLPFVDGAGEMIGIHQTWIDMDVAPKRRPVLYGLSKAGAGAGREDRAGPPTSAWPSAEDLAAGYYERLPTKKMRGTKKGGLLPIAGDMSASRWVVGEGSENVCAWLGKELREDFQLALSTFYAAAGDIGNLAGAAARTGRWKHPLETTVNAAGAVRPVMLPSPDPDPERLDEGFPVLAHITELVLLGDGDSEPYWTATMMARAQARALLLAPKARVPVLWPPAGQDWAETILEGMRGDAA